MKTATSALGVLLLCLAAAARGADPVPAALLACEKVQDTAERAHCYDSQLAAMKAAATPPSAPGRHPATARQPQAASFGSDQLPIAKRPRPVAADVALVSRITSIRTAGPKIWLITLANTQVWRQEGTGTTGFLRAGDEVRIEKGLLEDYRLSAARIGSKNWVRVSRIQ